MSTRPPARDHLAPAPLVAAADWAQDGPQDGRTDGRTGDDVFDGWSLAAKVVFLWQLAALGAGAERPVSRRQMKINSNAFAKAMEYLTFCHIIHPVLGEDRRPRWHWDAAECAARWMADYGDKR